MPARKPGPRTTTPAVALCAVALVVTMAAGCTARNAERDAAAVPDAADASAEPALDDGGLDGFAVDASDGSAPDGTPIDVPALDATRDGARESGPPDAHAPDDGAPSTDGASRPPPHPYWTAMGLGCDSPPVVDGRVVFAVESDPLAVCNDGSPPVYAIRPGIGAMASTFLIELDGGGACTDVPSCMRRARPNAEGRHPAVSTCDLHLDPDVELHGGWWSDDPARNPFVDATRVYVHYCSSDLWSGDRAASEATGWFHFRGHRILAALFEDLHRRHGLAGATRIVLAGTSAGAHGVLTNADFIGDWLARRGIRAAYMALADAGWAQASTGAGGSGVVELFHMFADESCVAAGHGILACHTGPTLAPHVTTRTLLHVPQNDEPALMMSPGCRTGGRSDSTVCDPTLARQVRDALSTAIALPTDLTVFSPYKRGHTIIDDDCRFFGMPGCVPPMTSWTIAGRSFADLAYPWMQGMTVESRIESPP
ncbi:MAG: pectin acetylesterase-family hydrolase [Myxococcota bacterium]|nr:pectin acetylesterase-family hydrolase [Myxococcota bacterium]